MREKERGGDNDGVRDRERRRERQNERERGGRPALFLSLSLPSAEKGGET
jgi:hypothetical protein